MARIFDGIPGDFIGTAGNVTRYMRNGKNFVRSKRRKSSALMSPKRQEQHQKIIVRNNFILPFCGRNFFNKTFPAYGHSCAGFNRVTGAIMNLAIIGTQAEGRQ